MRRWGRFFYHPCMPIGMDGSRITESKEHIALSKEAATEGMVLLKNEQNTLPLQMGQKVALFGKASADYVKGGGGSGDVHVSYVHNLIDGMRIKAAEGKVSIYEPLADFYEQNIEKQYAQGIAPGLTIEPEIPETLLCGAKAFTDTAIVSICRFSGEGWDRVTEMEHEHTSYGAKKYDSFTKRCAEVFENGDFYLSRAEEKMVHTVKEHFANVIVVLNVGGVVSTEWFAQEPRIQAALLAWQAGMEGGLATAELLVGDVSPSGKLGDTFAKRLADYPSSEHFHDSEEYVAYTEDIYVGYRYFETLPQADQRVVYPFGYGLSYTQFEIAADHVFVTEEQIKVLCRVTNVGTKAGKEVIQLYVQAPQGKLGKPNKELKAFAKTRLLQPGETQTISLHIAISQLASYDDLGKIQASAYVLEKGTYTLWLGNNVQDAKIFVLDHEVAENRVIEQLSSKCVPNMLPKRLLSDGTLETLSTDASAVQVSVWDEAYCKRYFPDVEVPRHRMNDGRKPEKRQFIEVAQGSCSLETFMEQLSVEDLIQLVCGHDNMGITDVFGYGCLPEYGVPSAMAVDGPAGIRSKTETEIHTTAFPCATLLACTWNEALVEQVGRAGANEAKENNLGVWLTPAMNIHRNPLCGRNFEYYSEDPLLTGKIGAAMVRGIQSCHIAASVKHFACNNKETNRRDCDSRVSERALREIYLKGFEIVVKEAKPWTIMSAYNILNGHRTSECKELLTDILRKEWGFDGMVTSDWYTHGEQYLEIKAGNDVKMGCGYPERLKKDFEEGRITKEEIYQSAKRVLELILKFD